MLFRIHFLPLTLTFSKYRPALPTLPRHWRLIKLADLTWGLNLKAGKKLACSDGYSGDFFFLILIFPRQGLAAVEAPARRVVNVVVIP